MLLLKAGFQTGVAGAQFGALQGLESSPLLPHTLCLPWKAVTSPAPDLVSMTNTQRELSALSKNTPLLPIPFSDSNRISQLGNLKSSANASDQGGLINVQVFAF